MRIFAAGAYTWGNKGDAALVTSFIEWLENDFGASEVELTSFTPAGDAPRYGRTVHHMVIRPMAPHRLVMDRLARGSRGARYALSRYRLAAADASYHWLRLWVRLYRMHPRFARVLGARSLWKLTSSMDRADFVFAVPGGYLLAPREIDDWWLYHVPNLILGKLLGKKVVLGPASIGPFAPGHKAAARRLLQYADRVVLREELSREYLEELGVPSGKIIMSPDMAFMHRPSPLSAAGVRAQRELFPEGHAPAVGVSVREHSFPGHSQPREKFESYVAAVIESLRWVAAAGASVILFSQTEEDVATTNLLSERLAHCGVAHSIADPSLTPSDLQVLYGHLDLLIGTRMHANILALSMGTPVVGIAYEPKTIGILRSIEREEWGLWIDSVDQGRLLRRVQEAWERRSERRAELGDIRSDLRYRFSSVASVVKQEAGI